MTPPRVQNDLFFCFYIFISGLLCCGKKYTQTAFYLFETGYYKVVFLELMVCSDILRVSHGVKENAEGGWRKKGLQTKLYWCHKPVVEECLVGVRGEQCVEFTRFVKKCFSFFYNIVLCVLFLWRLCNRCTFCCSSNFTWFCLEGSVWVHNAIQTLAE